MVTFKYGKLIHIFSVYWNYKKVSSYIFPHNTICQGNVLSKIHTSNLLNN